jgi:PelA/Pel-15E family pectate lyase
MRRQAVIARRAGLLDLPGLSLYWYTHSMLCRPVVTTVVACVASVALFTAVKWAEVLTQSSAWYRGSEARAIADAVLSYQRDSGGWPKDIDMTVPATGASSRGQDSTIDNGATTTQIRFLARVSTGHDRYGAAALRGIDYLFAAQYPNGGWPQVFPLRKDYSRHVTFNDNAMVNVLEVLEDVAARRPEFAFVDEARRAHADRAIERAVDVVLSSQIRRDGTLTAWCAQHDEMTLEPRPARTYEHASLSGMETVGIVRFLMRRPPTARIVRAVDAAAAWLENVRIGDGQWARFYELHTDRPIFSGRDGIVRYNLGEIEQERREGYAWIGTWPRNLVGNEYPAWKRRIAGKLPKE